MNATVTPLSSTSELSLLSGSNVLLEGPGGTGKTHCLATIAECKPGPELFVLFTEPGLETFLGFWKDRGLEPPENVHWHMLPKPNLTFDVLAKGAKDVNEKAIELLHKMNDPERSKHNAFWSMLTALADFPDDRTGHKFGPVDKWGPDRCIAIDSLTGINPIAMSLVIGNKPVRSPADWGIAQDQIYKLICHLTDDCKCHFVLTAHVEREVDQINGGVKLTVATLGKALPPLIPPKFSEVVLTVRLGKDYSWDTINPLADLKRRSLPLSDKIPPDFKEVFTVWQRRGGRFVTNVKS